VIRTVSFVAVK